MNILICEDEAPARKQLARFIHLVQPDATIVAMVDTGKEAKKYIRAGNLDLIFLDIELADGPCFETLNDIQFDVPVIFTTAYDEYALRAFELNSVDYLVKPITRTLVSQAFGKLDTLRSVLAEDPFVMNKELFRQERFKERFLVKIGRKLLPIAHTDIAYFQAEEKLVFLVTNQGKRYVVNYTLLELEDLLDPRMFFRLNRQFVASHTAIRQLEPYFKGQVVVELEPKPAQDIVVSRSQTPLLKTWMGY